MNQAGEIEKQVLFLEERQAKLKKEIYSRNIKLKELQIELNVYEKLKPKQGA